jgi:aryl-alcohol dehydrogenase-like predicted oxidoreductase
LLGICFQLFRRVSRASAGKGRGALAPDETGLILIQMAIAFVTRHPAVTSAFIGPRTMEHLDSYPAAVSGRTWFRDAVECQTPAVELER